MIRLVPDYINLFLDRNMSSKLKPLDVKHFECPHGSKAPVDRITSVYYDGDLEVSQAEPGRHGCAACAYNRGWEDALEMFRIRFKALLAEEKL
jgi:hypothetical protein